MALLYVERVSVTSCSFFSFVLLLRLVSLVGMSNVLKFSTRPPAVSATVTSDVLFLTNSSFTNNTAESHGGTNACHFCCYLQIDTVALRLLTNGSAAVYMSNITGVIISLLHFSGNRVLNLNGQQTGVIELNFVDNFILGMPTICPITCMHGPPHQSIDSIWSHDNQLVPGSLNDIAITTPANLANFTFVRLVQSICLLCCIFLGNSPLSSSFTFGPFDVRHTLKQTVFT